jgi:hypothetical protein
MHAAEAQTSVQGQTVRLGGGFADVLATRAGGPLSHGDRHHQGRGRRRGRHRPYPPSGAAHGRPAQRAAVHNYQVLEIHRATEVTMSTTAGHHAPTITA